MSYNSMEEATKQGEKVRDALAKPEKWELKVWKNHGSWHWALNSGKLRLHSSYNAAYRDHPTRYSCLLGDSEKSGGGSYLWYDQTWYDDPQEAVDAQAKLARERLDVITGIVEHVETLL
jgi:hypothetical protein